MKTFAYICGFSLVALPIWVALAADTPDNQPESGISQPSTLANTDKPVEASKPATSRVVALTPVQTAKKPILLSYGSDQIMRLIEAKVENSVIKAYVENSVTASAPSAEEIIYLRDHGLSSDILTLLIKRGHQLQTQSAQVRKVSQPIDAQANAVYRTDGTETAYDSPPAKVESINIQPDTSSVYYDSSGDYYVQPYDDYWVSGYGPPIISGGWFFNRPPPIHLRPGGPPLSPGFGGGPRLHGSLGMRPSFGGPQRSGPGPAMRGNLGGGGGPPGGRGGGGPPGGGGGGPPGGGGARGGGGGGGGGGGRGGGGGGPGGPR